MTRAGPKILAIATIATLGACTAPMAQNTADASGFISQLPEEVLNMAAPSQNLAAVKLLDDGCYWYQHQGPVETTLLPLRTREGRPICTATAA